MRLVRPTISVLEGGVGKRVRSPLEAAYDHFRLERQGDLVSPATLEHYDAMVVPLLTWVMEGQASDASRIWTWASSGLTGRSSLPDRGRSTAGHCNRGRSLTLTGRC